MEKTIELKLSELAAYESVHHWLADKLNFPAHYGHNLDSLWDCLTGEISLPITILWYNDSNNDTDYSAITTIFEEAAGEVEALSFGYIVDEYE